MSYFPVYFSGLLSMDNRYAKNFSISRYISRCLLRSVIVFLALTQSVFVLAADLVPSLELTGIEGDLAENIKLSVDPARYQCADSEWQLSYLKKKVRKQAQLALQALGYYQSKINLSIRQSEQCWTFVMDVQAGEPVILTEVHVEVLGELAELPAYIKFTEKLPLQINKPLKHEHYKKTKSEIEVLAARYGFFNGQFTEHSLDIDIKNNQVFARLIFESGSRVHFGEIEIDYSIYDELFIQQFITLKTDSPFDSHALIKQQQILNGSGYFSTVEVAAERESISENKIPVKINLEPIKKHAYRFGVGASTDIGPRVSFNYKNRRVNRMGHELGFDSSFSKVRNEITLDYGIPQGKAGAERLDFQTGYLMEDTDSSENEAYKIAALLTRVSDSGWVRTVFLEYLFEDFKVAETNRQSELLMPGVRLKKTVSDNTIFPRKGWRFDISARVASEDLLSSTRLLQLTTSSKLIIPFGKGRLLARVEFAASDVGDFEKLPASLRFFAGGDGSVRGFDYKSLGPVDINGDVTGGKNLLTGSLEYEHPIREQWGLALFVDTGNAFNNFSDYELFTGVGVGLRWHSPIGPIRLDVAQDVEQEFSPRLHLSMGLDL